MLEFHVNSGTTNIFFVCVLAVLFYEHFFSQPAFIKLLVSIFKNHIFEVNTLRENLSV